MECRWLMAVVEWFSSLRTIEQIALASLSVSLVSLIVAAVMGSYAYQVNRRQLELIGRRADLRLSVRVVPPTKGRPQLDLNLFASNIGQRSARDFYWHFLIPSHFSLQPITTEGGATVPSQSQEGINGVTWVHYRGFHSEPAYPHRNTAVATITANDPNFKGTVGVGWQYTSEDGIFPPPKDGDAKAGLFTVTVPPSEPASENS